MGNCFSKKPDKKAVPPDFTNLDHRGSNTSRVVAINKNLNNNNNNVNNGSNTNMINLQKRPGQTSSSQLSQSNLKHLHELRNRYNNNHKNSCGESDDITTTTSQVTRSTASSLSSSNHSELLLQQQQNSNKSSNSKNGNNKNAYIALYDYESRTSQDLSFKKGDILYITDEDKQVNGWWKARLKDSSRVGYIPAQFVAPINSLESQPWYFGNVKRLEAEKQLLTEANRNGSFLVRTSDGSNHAFSLSVRDSDSIKHYRIHLIEAKYFITKKAQFACLNDLINYYTKKADGLCVQLTLPCVKTEKPVTKGLTHSFMKDYEMDKAKFRLEKKIGQGQFGDVWQAEFIENRMKVAIKTLKEGMNPDDFRAEAEIMRNLYHTKLIQLYALCTKEEPIYIVTELMSNGSLLDYLQTPIGKRLQLDTLIYAASQIADGMAYLESLGYIHRDLAARNVLVGDNNEVKVADFGLARAIKDSSTIYSAREGTKFPIKWTAVINLIILIFIYKNSVQLRCLNKIFGPSFSL
jgi:tRNA A-37 threonylcarbamoyl transferase component Bud32